MARLGLREWQARACDGCGGGVQYDTATETLTKLREAIDMHLFADALKQLQQRTWLLHWALFIFWNTSDGPSQLLDLCLQDKFTVAMQVNSPHLLRCASRLSPLALPRLLSTQRLQRGAQQGAQQGLQQGCELQHCSRVLSMWLPAAADAGTGAQHAAAPRCSDVFPRVWLVRCATQQASPW